MFLFRSLTVRSESALILKVICIPPRNWLARILIEQSAYKQKYSVTSEEIDAGCRASEKGGEGVLSLGQSQLSVARWKR